jgi:hypothetical protein
MSEMFSTVSYSLLPYSYRIGSFVVLTVLEDPAILALGFC